MSMNSQVKYEKNWISNLTKNWIVLCRLSSKIRLLNGLILMSLNTMKSEMTSLIRLALSFVIKVILRTSIWSRRKYFNMFFFFTRFWSWPKVLGRPNMKDTTVRETGPAVPKLLRNSCTILKMDYVTMSKTCGTTMNGLITPPIPHRLSKYLLYILLLSVAYNILFLPFLDC